MLPAMQLQNSNCTQRSQPDVAVATIVDVAAVVAVAIAVAVVGS